MSKFVVNLNEPQETPKKTNVPEFGDYQKPKKRSAVKKVLGILGIALAVILFVVAIGAYFYWQNLKESPQYSLALLIDAARRDDQQAVDELVDVDAVVDDFVPQITGKAIELYGRGLPPQTISRIAQIAAPFLPAVKQRARDEIPTIIREKTKKFESVPFWAIALGADRFVEIRQEGDKAFVQSKIENRPLELTLRQNGERWQVVGLKDEELARRIAERIGQQIIAIARNKDGKNSGKELGVENLQDLIKEAEGLFK
jgi:hypothetical protein